MSRFSERNNYAPSDPEITIREDAPEEFRGVLVDIAYEAGLDPHKMRSLTCRVLRKREDPSNWSAFPNVDGEVREHLDGCEWYEVYEVLEAVHAKLQRETSSTFMSDDSKSSAEGFSNEVNQYFRKRGIGWQLREGHVEARGSETFEVVLQDASEALHRTKRVTAASELQAAIQDLSRRPTPDITGAIQHSMAALECVARDTSGDAKSTLGSLISSNPDLFPRPVDDAITKLWGFASEYGRHLREGRLPEFAEALLTVHITAASIRYLLEKHSKLNS